MNGKLFRMISGLRMTIEKMLHNERVRERAQRELSKSANGRLPSTTNGLHNPKMTKTKVAKLIKEQMRQHHLFISGHYDESTAESPRLSQHDPTLSSSSSKSTYDGPSTEERLVNSATLKN